MTPDEVLEERRAYEEEQQRIEKLLRTVKFGMSVEAFLDSDIGQYLQARALHDRNAALEELAAAPFDQPSTVLEIQNRIRVIDQWQHWLGDAINEGVSAQKAYVDLDTAA